VRIHPAAISLAVILLGLVAWATWTNYIWDEINGHDPISAAIARGVAPPEHPLFPGDPFRYHLAFDVLAGILRAFTWITISHAIDTITVISFILLMMSAASIGMRLGGRAAASLALLLAPLAGGTFVYLLFTEIGSIQVHVDGIPLTWYNNVPPTVISNFFQHPQGLAMPVSLAILMLFDDQGVDQRTRVARVVLGSVLLGMLSFAQIVFFAVIGFALGVSVLVRAFERRNFRSGAIELSCLAASVGIAFAIGGFFERSAAPKGDAMLELGKSFFGEPWLTSIAHHVFVFGLPLIAAPIALFRLKGEGRMLRIMLFAATAVAFLIPNLVVYARSWDVVKFYGVGGFFANLLFADTLAILFKRTVWRPALGVVLAILSVVAGLMWLARMSVFDGRWGVPKYHIPKPPDIAEQLADELDPLVGTYQRVFDTSIELAAAGGFLTPGFNPLREGGGYMLDRPKYLRLNDAYSRARKTLARTDLDILGADFVVLSRGDIGSLEKDAKEALEDPKRFEHVFDTTLYNDIRKVYRVVRGP
jgi:hypothetical protein